MVVPQVQTLADACAAVTLPMVRVAPKAVPELVPMAVPMVVVVVPQVQALADACAAAAMPMVMVVPTVAPMAVPMAVPTEVPTAQHQRISPDVSHQAVGNRDGKIGDLGPSAARAEKN